MTQEQNLLSGSVPRKLIAFALPLLLANILQSFYNVVDMLVVGQFVGETGLAAISNASKLCYIINSICIGMTMGGTVLIAQYKGANNKKDQAETFQMLSMLSLAASILLTVISLAGYQPLFRALKVPADALGDACDYMKIICYGTVFVFGYNAVCSVLKGLGDSKSPLCFVGIATIINVGLDIILVGPLGMGTIGAACATVTAQGISFVISLFYLKRYRVFFGTAECKKLAVQWDKIVAILKIGLPTAIQIVGADAERRLRNMTEPIHKGKDLPPVWVIHAASSGDSEALEKALRYYDCYMSRLCTPPSMTRTEPLMCAWMPI